MILGDQSPTVLYETNASDFVQNAIANTGVIVSWRELTRNEAASHGTRIRAYRQDIDQAYRVLDDEQKGHFAQIVVKAILERFNGQELRVKLLDRLHDIGWTITDAGLLSTEDALLREQFFPPNSEYDAYVSIRDVLGRAKRDIIVEDAYEALPSYRH